MGTSVQWWTLVRPKAEPVSRASVCAFVSGGTRLAVHMKDHRTSQLAPGQGIMSVRRVEAAGCFDMGSVGTGSRRWLRPGAQRWELGRLRVGGGEGAGNSLGREARAGVHRGR